MAHISFSQLQQPRLANIMNIQGSFAQQTSGPQTLRVTKASLICDVDTAPDAVTARGLGAGLGSCAEVLCFHHFPNYSVTRVTPPVLYCTVMYCTIVYCTVLYCTALSLFCFQWSRPKHFGQMGLYHSR